jgi:hypothetical protein
LRCSFINNPTLKSKNFHIRIVAVMLLPAMWWLFFNSEANWHYHLSPTGEVIKHSHPYTHSERPDDSPLPFQEHNHKQADYVCLEQVTQTGALEAGPCELLQFFSSERDCCAPEFYLPPASAPRLLNTFFRGPPAIS